MNFFSLIKQLCMCFTCKNKLPKTIIVIFPGFGFSPKDYENILPKKTAKIYIDIWTEDELNNIKKSSLENKQNYEEWMEQIVSRSKDILFLELKKYDHVLPKTIYFTHSIGSIIGERLKSYADIIISYGGVIEPSHIKTLNLLGTEDKIATMKYDIWPKNAKPILNANHFSCVSFESKNLTNKWVKEMNYSQTVEKNNYNDKRLLIKSEIETFINFNIIKKGC